MPNIMIRTESGKMVFNRARQLVEFAADYHNLTYDRIIRRDRTRIFAYIRFCIMIVMREEMNLTLPRMAKELGYADHTSVIHGLAEGEKLVAQFKPYADFVAAMREFADGQQREAA